MLIRLYMCMRSELMMKVSMEKMREIAAALSADWMTSLTHGMCGKCSSILHSRLQDMASSGNRMERMGEQYLGDDCLTTEIKKTLIHLKNTNISIISLWGWDGIGKSIIGNRIIDGAKKKQETYFDVVIVASVPRPWIPSSDIIDQSYPGNDVPNITVQRAFAPPILWKKDEGSSRKETLLFWLMQQAAELEEQSRRSREDRKRELKEQRRKELQAKIMTELKLNVGQSDFAAAANRLSHWLARQKFLIMLTDVWEYIDLTEIGVPLTNPGNGSKIIIIPKYEIIHRQIKADLLLGQNFRSLPEDEAWQLLRAEARDAAAALSFYPEILSSTKILECFSYLSLFHPGTPGDASSLTEFWRSEGFFDEMVTRLQAAEEEEDRIEELMEITADALLVQLLERCMLNSFQEEFQMPSGVKELVASRNRFLIQCNSSSQVPQLNQWEAAERISLSHNQIQELPTEQLDMHSSPNCQRLLTLFLNDNKRLRSISDDFFKNMTGLQVLNLSATGIKFLPSSISCLCHLRMLKLRNCRDLEALPAFIKDLPKLEVLDIGQTSLPRMVEASFEGMSSLRILDISNGAVKNLTQLSVQDCRSLSRLVGLEGLLKLATLDLSRTKIEWLPHKVFNRPGLKRLHLLGMEHLQMIEWNKIKRLPEELNWHRQSKEPPLKEQPQGNNDRFSISVSHDSIFQSLDQTSELSNSHLQKFYFLICSCERGPKYRQNHFKRSRFCYSRVCDEHDSSTRNQRLLKYDRWVEVCGGKSYLNGLRGVLSMADFYCLRGNEFIQTAFNEGMQLGNLKECWIEKCDQLERVCKGNFGSGSFSCLKHLYLQCCPKLINIFSSSIQLKQLELLEIKFCGRLENIHPDENVGGQDAFPELAELHLWELGKLKRICSGYLPKLKKLKIGGCPLLKQLPLNCDDSSAAYVQIRGEAAWWKGIVWKGGVMPKTIRFRDHCLFKG